ncbi:MAG TPA: DUF3830 family protein [Gemmatimonadaceae bacterium]|nr:DUF3830 family protein [Gemmatimonadaceae bacterium]
MIRIRVADLVFRARLEWERAPHTVEALLRLLPLSGSLLQARWSGEAAWMPLGSLETGVGTENDTQHPEPGQVLLHPMGISETEILIPYGVTVFGSRAGPLRGNHVMTIVEGMEQLPELGRRVLWEGAQSIHLVAVSQPAGAPS